MLTLRKGDAVKVLSPESSLVEGLKREGWEVEGEKVKGVNPVGAGDNLEAALRAEAEALGLKVHHKAGADKIREMIAEAKDVK